MAYLVYRKLLQLFYIFGLCCVLNLCRILAAETLSCDSLLPGQYLCDLSPEIDSYTQEIVGCGSDNFARIQCRAAENLTCEGIGANQTFTKTVRCHHTNGKEFKTALLLSIFFGWLGIDRFYLGYVAVGLFKLFTFGFFFIFHLIDIILIALQVVGPADGSAYVMDYYGPRATYIRFTNATNILSSSHDSVSHEL